MSGGPDPPYVRARTALLDAADALAEQLDALEQALYALLSTSSSITAIGARQDLSIRYTERLAEAGIEPSVGSVGDAYDNALAESVIGL